MGIIVYASSTTWLKISTTVPGLLNNKKNLINIQKNFFKYAYFAFKKTKFHPYLMWWTYQTDAAPIPATLIIISVSLEEGRGQLKG
jgi:hypothetical protein